MEKKEDFLVYSIHSLVKDRPEIFSRMSVQGQQKLRTIIERRRTLPKYSQLESVIKNLLKNYPST